mgnify:CR=1 FL=1
MIRELKKSDISGLNSLPPIDWKFDYEDFLNDFVGENYFRAFVMIQDTKIVGTGNVFFRDKIGWLANIIIDESLRGKGLGFKMTKFLYHLDNLANGENRTHLIDKYYKTGFGYFNSDNDLLGFYLPDFGRGLVLSNDTKAGVELLKLKHSKKEIRTLLPIDNNAGIDFFKTSGLKKGYKCSRMILGKQNKWNPKYIYSYGSGYCG